MPSEWLGYPLWETHPLARGVIDPTERSGLCRKVAKKIRFPDCDKSHRRIARQSLCFLTMAANLPEEKSPMHVDATRTVRDLATEIPNATRIFERFGIDYCCGGGKPLQDACRQANIPVDEVLRSLQGESAAGNENVRTNPDFKAAPLTDLIAYILATHHGYVKQEIPRLKQLFFKVVAVHGPGHPELAAVQRT